MKQITLFLIRAYQMVLSPLIKQLIGVQRMCKYTPSCSEYTRQMIQKFGVIRGSIMGVERLVACR